MSSQSIWAQLMRMTLLLVLSLVVVHHSPRLLQLLAEQAMNSVCHQQSEHSHHNVAHHSHSAHSTHH
ncbi:hypothetical protein HGG78_08435 [Vibrio aestuarianus]|uniref:hypothetical protein n=1 Tax=Vibrio aestuarianus TaxID=28171 RepID=UPI0015599CC7|nr:hypothetical protein [Vibrio aestuarianus]NGZ13771.1 hypothetical protein [Vibrio aestuarianus]NKZ49919.1 hypothetical protein [Vibrio aestuarianus]